MAKTLTITEKQFQNQVIELCKIFGYEYYHTWKSLHSPKGYPDLILIRPPKLIVAELKSEKGKLTPFQDKWLEMFRNCGIEAYVWRPSDFDRIVEILQ